LKEGRKEDDDDDDDDDDDIFWGSRRPGTETHNSSFQKP
jgi:hypothetical protein